MSSHHIYYLLNALEHNMKPIQKNKGYRAERGERLVSVILPSMHGTEVKYI